MIATNKDFAICLFRDGSTLKFVIIVTNGALRIIRFYPTLLFVILHHNNALTIKNNNNKKLKTALNLLKVKTL